MKITEIYHHGVKGQRWGVRRYQNKDGSLTQAGKKRMQEGFDDSDKLAKSFAKIENMNRAVRKGWDGKSQILMSPEDKKAFDKAYQDFLDNWNVMKKKYSDVVTDIRTENGRDYVYVMLRDKVTGNGYQQGYNVIDK